MNYREQEQALLDRCQAVAVGHAMQARTQVEASLFHLAAMTLERQYPAWAQRLWHAGDIWFEQHRQQALPPGRLIANGQLISLPRLHDMLVKQLEQQKRHA